VSIARAAASMPTAITPHGQADIASAGELAQADPPGPADRSGWTPAERRYVRSAGESGWVRGALKFVGEPAREAPGQRLSTAMVDEFAPVYSRQFGMDEQHVRQLLGKVYLYVGGVTDGGRMATTIGTHVFMPSNADMDTILSPRGRRWLAHELAHVLQNSRYDGGSIFGSLSDYGQGLLIGRNPVEPGTGGGPRVWGSIITGGRIVHGDQPGARPGDASSDLRDRLQFSVAPAAVTGTALGIFTGGLVDAARYMGKPGGVAAAGLGRATPLPSHWNGWLTGVAMVTAPMLAGGIAGLASRELGARGTDIAGGLGGAAVAAGGMLLLRNHLRGGSPAASGWRGWIPVALGAALGAAQGLAVARISANTISGWSDTSKLIAARQHVQAPPATLGDAVHDAHWLEIDAAAAAAEYLGVRHGARDIDTSAFDGRLPDPPGRMRERLAWAVENPLLVGLPAAAVAGSAVLATRGVLGGLRSVGEGHGLLASVRASFATLGSRRQGLPNSFGVGSALTAVPLLAGGIAGSALDAIGVERDPARLGGAAVAGTLAGAQLTWLLRRASPSGSPLLLAAKVAAGTALAAGLGYVAASASTRAGRVLEREYRLPSTG
jgi:Domain of unknown function (DUF4157)